MWVALGLTIGLTALAFVRGKSKVMPTDTRSASLHGDQAKVEFLKRPFEHGTAHSFRRKMSEREQRLLRNRLQEHHCSRLNCDVQIGSILLTR